MRILMLGWEFPPFISGGLGTACHGLTKGLDRLGHEVLFVLPRSVDRTHASHVRLLSPEPAPDGGHWVDRPGASHEVILRAAAGEPIAPPAAAPAIPGAESYTVEGLPNATFFSLPAQFSSPYGSGQPVAFDSIVAALAGLPPDRRRREIEALIAAGIEIPAGPEWEELLGVASLPAEREYVPAPRGDYSGDLFAQAQAYARLVLRLARTESFDVVHAHDWLTFPAGLTVARATNRPLVVHVHATEFDRSGEHVNQRVYDIERRGMHGAIRVACVSEFTRRICEHRYGVDPAKLRVVYNGVESDSAQPRAGQRIEARDRIVLFLGRITMQKGPEYFIQAAKRVLEKIDNVKFVVAGSGDMASRMIEYAASLGIGHKVLFTGFLRGRDVSRVFEMADLYVMPSVSEPFGIAPLEALSHGTPVIISKQSGVSEVLTHALKVDFWDIEDMANKIVAVLKRPVLGKTLREHGVMEVRKLTWDDAGVRMTRVYEEAVAAIRGA